MSKEQRKSASGDTILFVIGVIVLAFSCAGLLAFGGAVRITAGLSFPFGLVLLCAGYIMRVRKSRSIEHDLLEKTGIILRLSGIRDSVIDLVTDNDEQAQDLITNIRAALFINQRIQEKIDAIAQKADESGENIRSISASAEEIQATLDSFEKRIESQSSAVVQTSSSLEEMNASLNSVSRIAREHRSQTKELVELADHGKTQAVQTNSLIKEINQHIDAVQSIIEVIDNVASQTNLLSMNAAIEAAHAGDAGKGFAVVAAEIRNLAESTANNARTIGGTLKQIIEEIGQAEDLGRSNLEYFSKVKDDVDQVANAFAEIDQATDEITIGSNEIVQATNDLVQITQEIQSDNREITESVRQLFRDLRAMIDANDQTDENTDKIDDTLTQNNRILSKLAEAALESVDSANDLEQEVVDSKRTVMNSNMASMRHLAWVFQLRQVIDGVDKKKKQMSPALEDCWISKWMASPEGKGYKNEEAMKDFVPLHREFHEKLSALMHKAAINPPSNRSDELDLEIENEYKQFLVLMTRTIDALDKLGGVVDSREAAKYGSVLTEDEKEAV